MSDQTIKLMELIKDGKTCNEICDILDISNKQLFNNLTNLRNKGLFYKRKYYSNGVIIYKTISSSKELKKCQLNGDNAIITPPEQKLLKCLVISDLHFGNQLERIDLVDKAYEYCIKNNIHIIFCCGDMLDGSFTKGEQKIEDTYLQMEHFIHDYPFDKNILNFCIAGDHDKSVLRRSSQDIVEIAKNYRHDIIIGGYKDSLVYVKNDKIALFHPIDSIGFKKKNAPIVLKGHSHKYEAKLNGSGNILTITVPSLSDINESFPTALELTLQFIKGYINFATMKQIFFSDKSYVLSEIRYDLLKNRDVQLKRIDYEEKLRTECLFKEKNKSKIKN